MTAKAARRRRPSAGLDGWLTATVVVDHHIVADAGHTAKAVAAHIRGAWDLAHDDVAHPALQVTRQRRRPNQPVVTPPTAGDVGERVERQTTGHLANRRCRRFVRILGALTALTLRLGLISVGNAMGAAGILAMVDRIVGAKVDLIDQIEQDILRDVDGDRRATLEDFFKELQLDQGLLSELSPELARHFDAS